MFLLIKLKVSKEKSKENIIKEEKLISYGYAFKFILPITLSSIVLPIASFLDSFIAINALKGIFYDKKHQKLKKHVKISKGGYFYG